MVRNIAIIENNILATNTIRNMLTHHLIDCGFNVVVLTTGISSELEKAKRDGIPVKDLKTNTNTVSGAWHYIRNLKKALDELKPDVVLTFTIRPNILGNLIARKRKIPVISNITGTGPLFESNKPFYMLVKRLYKLALKKTKWIFFQNNDDLQLFLRQKISRPENVQVIPGSGVDTEYFLPVDSVPETNSFTFLFVGRLIKDKGILEFLNAAKSIKKNYPEIIFQIVGPFWTQNFRLNSISKKQLTHWINKGVVKYDGNADDVRPYINHAQCIVLPSYREGMSNILLEAGSMAKPCIASRVTGCKEIIEDGVTGLLCNPKDSEDLAKKMLEMYHRDCKTRNQMGCAAREKIESQFDKKYVIEAYLNAIKKI